ncbi:MAG: helix-turn-helix domain-containing protein [Gammaproteobacteria bacterium]|nr:helix-turn-helix domain-containing protein [Gammaproteobacteria bacterium]
MDKGNGDSGRFNGRSYHAMRPLVDCKALTGTCLFKGVDERFLLNMVTCMQREHWPRGYLLKCPEETQERFHLLLTGRVKIGRHHVDNGRELTFCVLGPGEGFNILNLIDCRGPYDLQIRTLDEVEALSAPVDRWSRWMDEYPVLRQSMAAIAAERIENLCQLASELALDDTMTRLVHLLLRHFNDRRRSLNLIRDLSQEELANMIGTVRPVVARLLGELRRDGVIDFSDGVLTIANLERLLERADGHLLNTVCD